MFDQQMQLPSEMLVLVLAPAQSTWTMLLAVVVKVNLLIAQAAPLLSALVAIQMMLEWDVKVREVYCTDNT